MNPKYQQSSLPPGDYIKKALLAHGAVAVGFSSAGPLPSCETERYAGWIEKGGNAGMSYLEKHATLRQTTDNVLPGAQTVISLAFAYKNFENRDPSLPMIASYALGEDYHEVIRRKMKDPLIDFKQRFGGEWRLCIDSAPVAERYRAIRGGIGKRGKNGAVIVDGCGSFCFLAEILTTLKLPIDAPCEEGCIGCNLCIKSCPTGALQEDGTIDSSRCLSYLTIEHKGEWSESQHNILSAPGIPSVLFGCDICLKICPHNRQTSAPIFEEFLPDPAIIDIKAEDIINLEPTELTRLIKRSPMRRAKREGLLRNAQETLKSKIR